MSKQGKLEAAGYERLPGTARRYRAPDGSVVSYREAFLRVRGRSLEEATKKPGKFKEVYDRARSHRRALKEGEQTRNLLGATEADRLTAKPLKKGLGRGGLMPPKYWDRYHGASPKVQYVLLIEAEEIPSTRDFIRQGSE